MRSLRTVSTIVLASLAAVLGGVASPLHAQQGPTQGYQLLADPQTTGAVLTATRAGTGSATVLLRQACAEVTSFFDNGRPQILGGFRDTQDRRVEVLFRATVRGAPVAGLGFAVVAAGTGAVGFAFDNPQMIAQSLPRLIQLTGGGSGAAPASGLNWREVPFPDGSGWMRLPDGWLITSAQKGIVEARGPQGFVVRDMWAPVYTRAAAQAAIQMTAQQSAYLGIALPPFVGLVADPTDPVSVLRELTPQFNVLTRQSGMPPENILRIVEVAPAPQEPGMPQSPGVSQAAFLDYELEWGGVRYRRIALLTLGTVTAGGSWIVVFSHVTSPVERFAQNLPVLMEIWGSAQTAQWVYTERLEIAMQSLREANQIWEQSTANRQRTEERIHTMWIEVIRGTRIVEDTETGRRSNVNLGWSTEIVTTLNRHEGYNRYREIPLWELNQ
jgi:hypothetical protein